MSATTDSRLAIYTHECVCCDCGETFLGNPGMIRCADCAYVSIRRQLDLAWSRHQIERVNRRRQAVGMRARHN